MAFAIYYFKDKSVEVGKIDWMSTEDQKNCSKIITQCPTLEEEDGWMSVKWEKGRKKKNCPALFPAKVLMFGDNYRDLCQKREQFIKGEDIWKQTLRRKTKPNSWLMEDVEEEENEQPKKQQKCKKTCTPKEAADQMIENLKKDLMAKQTSLQSTIENESSSDEDILARNWSKVQQQMKELKRENKRLKEDFKQILDAMRELPTQLKEVIGQITVTAPHASTSATASTSVDSASVSPQVLSDDMVFLMPGCNVKVPKRKLNSLWMANPSVYTGDLAALVYGRETLSHSSLTGRQSGAHKDVESKPQLDSTKLDAIFDHALSKFPDITMQDVRRIIRKKCNNESYIKQATAKKAI
ncbi:BEN domain-containing protein 6-like isoform X1 [Pseudorasbora parva]|uniref:BEN domain-containing protein 6-like isoform X1 n=1 Tax=Pseudorasbora parva TaxID=51549 RepID=UPI00351E60AB